MPAFISSDKAQLQALQCSPQRLEAAKESLLIQVRNALLFRWLPS